MNKIQFISPEINHDYIRPISKYLDIEFTANYDRIKASKKIPLIWNPYAYLVSGKERHKKKLDFYTHCLKEKNMITVVERGALPNTIFVDGGGFLNDSLSYNETQWNYALDNFQVIKTAEFIKNFTYNKTSLEPQQERLNYNDFKDELFINGDKQVVFIPLQVHNDTVIKLWSDWVISIDNFIETIMTLVYNNPDKIFLIKQHPVERKNYNIPLLPNIRIVDNYHYKDLIEYSDKILTINSGIGLQAMMWLKPVIILGNAYYNISNVNYKVNDINETHLALNKDLTVDINKMRRFIYYLKFKFYSDVIIEKLGISKSRINEIINFRYEI